MAQSLAFIMFPALVIFLLCGYPVAFVLGGVALIFGVTGFGLDFFTLLPMRIWTRMTNFTLVAVPLFIFMGIMLEQSGLAEDLLGTMSKLFGKIRGGVAVSVVIVGGLLAASTGIVGATVVTMGVISLPVMLKRKYNHGLAAGTISASGTLGQIIPPSIVLILLGDVMGVPIGSLFAAALLPGTLLVGLYITFIIIYSLIRPDVAPGLSKEEWESIRGKTLFIMVIKTLLPPAFLIVAVLGSIFFGIASPTEAAAIGAIGATILAIAKKNFNFTILRNVMQTTTRLSSMAFMILLGATAFGLVFRGLDGDQMVREFLEHFGGGYWGILFIVMLILFLLGFFLDFIEITFIVIPIIAPILSDMGFNMIWFCILIAVNFVSPPEVVTGEIYKGAIPFILIQLIGLALIILFPKIVTWLPSVIYGY